MNDPIGKRIRSFRLMRGMTGRQLGEALGFPSRSASIRIVQYESGVRTPKPALLKQIADVLNISVNALTTPDLESTEGLMHTMFALEDACILSVASLPDGIELWLDTENERTPLAVRVMLKTWAELHRRYICGKITREEYDQWRYNFPNIPRDEDRVI